MKNIGIICEYNPLHIGHAKQIRYIKENFPNSTVVCLMSGNYVQRGQPAIFDKSLRSHAALSAGADLVLELPTTCALSSAEGFAAGGVAILGQFCDALCFGCEQGTIDRLMATAHALLAEDFPQKLHQALGKGLSFPAARQAALGTSGSLLENPNDILAVEYCKAILQQRLSMDILPIRREGSYHAQLPDEDNPSATAVRNLICENLPWERYVPNPELYKNAPIHTIQNGEQAILYRLRSMTETEFAALPYGSEGLWRKLMHASRNCNRLDDIIAATKSKRYTRSRIDRMILCAYLGIDQTVLSAPVPYTRVLGFNDSGRILLRNIKKQGNFPNIGEKTEDPYQQLERRWDDLYGLFAYPTVAPGKTDLRRILYRKE